MNKEQLFDVFKMMFPDWSKAVISYKKIGSKTLAITFLDHDVTTSRVFLYNNSNDWQFGTKLWRKRPDKLRKKNKEVKNVDKKDCNSI